MAGKENTPDNVYSANDTLDINELAALNNDISPEFIEQLQNQVSQTASNFSGKATSDDSELFEEVPEKAEEEQSPEKNEEVATSDEQPAAPDANLDDNFVKKYNARLNNKNGSLADEQIAKAQAEEEARIKAEEEARIKAEEEAKAKAEEEARIKAEEEAKARIETPAMQPSPEEIQSQADANVQQPAIQSKSEIEALSGGNIIEKKLDKKEIEYNQSLEKADNNVKYEKYVIYINPENKDFIDSLTVKERKNLINRIIREQDDIAITKRRFNALQTILRHAIIAILTVTVATPIIYCAINASLEAIINNHRKSQSLFQTLYKDHGKIKNNIK